MVEAYKSAFKNYANFKDRTSRSGYWFFVLANLLVSFAIGFILGLIAGLTGNLAISGLAYIYSLVVFIPSLSIMVRRLHDVNKSGWAVLFSLIPLIGWIFVLVWLCSASVNENNNYGQQV